MALLSALAVLSGSIAVPLLCRPFYYAHIQALDLTGYTGLTVEQIRQAFDQVMDDCLGLRPDFAAGVLWFSESGASHFADVRRLFLLDLWILGLSLAALAAKDMDSENQMQLVWVASSLMLDDAYNQYSSDANEDFVLNALEMMCEKDDSVSVRSKSLTNEYLTVSTSDASFLKVVTIGIILVRRKRR